MVLPPCYDYMSMHIVSCHINVYLFYLLSQLLLDVVALTAMAPAIVLLFPFHCHSASFCSAPFPAVPFPVAYLAI